MLNMNCNMMLYRVFPKIFKTDFPKDTSDKIHLLKGTYYNCFICLTGNYMTKPTFKPRERSEKSTSCSHNKNTKIYGTTNTQIPEGTIYC